MKFKRGQKVVCIEEWDDISDNVGKLYTVTKVWSMKNYFEQSYQLLGFKELERGSMFNASNFRLATKLDKALK